MADNGTGAATGAAAGTRDQWGSKLGFILAAAGSAVGLGNIWKFPYITGENGGGLFVIIYLICIGLVGLPIMIGEIMVGRASQRSPVPAFEELGGKKIWGLIGWMGVATGFILLSYYSVIAGWAFAYIKLAVTNAFADQTPEQIGGIFSALAGSVSQSTLWHFLFMGLTVAVVLGGVQKGIERGARILMPALFFMMLILVIDGMTQKGFGSAAEFIFAPNTDKLTGAGVLEALGHSFFTLSLGMGALITYGSYLGRKDDIVLASGAISLMDTAVALMACLVMFPVIFSYGMEPGAGPGLVFISMPVAFSQMTGGAILAVVFFVLLLFAALTSAISLLEVVVATFIDKFGWDRKKATIGLGIAIFVFGVPSAGADKDLFPFWQEWFGRSWLDSFDYVVSNWFLPLGGLAIAVFAGWVMPKTATREQFTEGTKLAGLYGGWLFLVRYVAPLAIILVFLYSIKVIPAAWLK